MSAVLDTGALIALERNDRSMWLALRALVDRELDILVPTTVVAQCWRATRKQARLHAALDMCTLAAFDPLCRQVGELLGRAKTKDVCDAHVALVAARYGLVVYTSDPGDIGRLLALCSTEPPTVIRV
jgi:predicted nucleic acid-binding protein